MKKIIRIAALLMVAVFALSAFASCGKSMDKIVDKIKDLDDEDYGYEKYKGSDFEDEAEDEFDIKAKGVEKAYVVYDLEDYTFAYVVEFEKSANAKDFAEKLEKDLEDILEEEYGDDYDADEFLVKKSGKIVIVGHEDIIKEIW